MPERRRSERESRELRDGGVGTRLRISRFGRLFVVEQ
jgi:hypothetical protein